MIKLLLRYSLLFAIIWTIIIFILCCTPGKYIPSSNWLELLSFDKIVHASIFFVLSFLWVTFLYQKGLFSNTYILCCLFICIAYGGSLEIMQATIFSERSGDWLDFIANSLGSVIGTIICTKKAIGYYK